MVKLVDSQRLSKAFVELADTLVGDFDALDFLHVLTTRCTQLLNVTAAGSCSPTLLETCA